MEETAGNGGTAREYSLALGWDPSAILLWLCVFHGVRKTHGNGRDDDEKTTAQSAARPDALSGAAAGDGAGGRRDDPDSFK